jgi:hypothetical protein
LSGGGVGGWVGAGSAIINAPLFGQFGMFSTKTLEDIKRNSIIFSVFGCIHDQIQEL